MASKEETQVLYVDDVARILGRTESAIRQALYRRSRGQVVDWLPETIRAGHRIAWNRAAFAHLVNPTQAIN